jgi:hypothetical protein
MRRVLALLVFLAACADETSAARVPLLEDVPVELAAATCASRAACALPSALGRNLDCFADPLGRLDNLELPAWKAAVARGTLVFAGERLAGCVERLIDTCALHDAFKTNYRCDAFVGQVALDGACELDVECAGEARCERAGCPGRCVALVALEGACRDDVECAGDSLCRDGKCIARAGEGGACNDEVGYFSCAASLACVQPDEASLGTCRRVDRLGSVGEDGDCDPDQGRFCKPGLSCNLTRHVCVPFVAAGAECAVGFPDSCPQGFHCDGTCWPLPGPSGRDNGQACLNPDDCYSGRCAGDVCAERERETCEL